MAEIRLQGVNKVYPDGTHAVKDVDLEILDGEFMIMVGPSGCAKSTLLRMIAGLEVPTSGAVEIGGRVMNDVSPKDRDIAMVFQSYALYPHMTVADNMAFGLRLRHMAESEIETRISDAARILGLEQLLHRRPKQLSGGQRQRVAMGRAIVREPQAFLMDEPLSNLDAKLRVQMRAEIAKLHSRLKTTTVYVTHDQVEAMTLGQRICILRLGEVQQVDTPYMVYTNPANVFVAGFIGSPGMNFMSGVIAQNEHGLWLQLGDQYFQLPASVCERLLDPRDIVGREVIVGIRPEHLRVKSPSSGDAALTVHVELVESMGSEIYTHYTCGIAVPDLSELDDSRGSGDVMPTFIAKLPPHTRAQADQDLELALDVGHVHLFDVRTHQTLLAPLLEDDTPLPFDITDEPVAAPAAAATFAPRPLVAAYTPQPLASPGRSSRPLVPAGLGAPDGHGKIPMRDATEAATDVPAAQDSTKLRAPAFRPVLSRSSKVFQSRPLFESSSKVPN